MLKFKIMLICFVCLVLNLFSETIRSIEDIKPNSFFEKYLSSEIPNYVCNYLSSINKKIDLPKKDYQLSIDTMSVSIPIQCHNAKKHPFKGEWHHRVTLTDGKKDLIYNITFIARENQPPEIIPRIMGNTKASLALELDVLFNLIIFSQTKIEETQPGEFYDTFMVIDSKEITPPASLFKKDGYYEEWLVQACGKKIPFIIEFISDNSGGFYFTIFDISEITFPK